MLTIVARPVPARSRSAAKRSTTLGRSCVSVEIAEARQDAQVEVGRVALLGREGEPALGVVRPPLAVDVFGERDLVREQCGVAGLLEPSHAPVEVARVVLAVEGSLPVDAAGAALAPAHHECDGAVGARFSVDAHAAVRLARSPAHAPAGYRSACCRRARGRACRAASTCAAPGEPAGFRVDPRGVEPCLEVALVDPQPPAGLVRGELAALDRAIDRPLREPNAGGRFLDGQHRRQPSSSFAAGQRKRVQRLVHALVGLRPRAARTRDGAAGGVCSERPRPGSDSGRRARPAIMCVTRLLRARCRLPRRAGRAARSACPRAPRSRRRAAARWRGRGVRPARARRARCCSCAHARSLRAGSSCGMGRHLTHEEDRRRVLAPVSCGVRASRIRARALREVLVDVGVGAAAGDLRRSRGS